MEKEKKVRLSIVMEEREHKYLKMCCAKLGVSIKDFVLNATIDRVDLCEDEWMSPTYKDRDDSRNERENSCVHTDVLLKELDLVGAVNV